MLHVLEHSSDRYSTRTYVNAKAADLTVAFAADFTTAGERLTHEAAGERYLAIPLGGDPVAAARHLYRALRQHNAHSLNVAGNGIYTLAKSYWLQEAVNQWVFAVLAKVYEHWPLQSVRSGGQTGVDLAGAIAAHALGIETTVLLPKGFIQRGVDKIDTPHSAAEIQAQIEQGAQGVLNPQ